MSQTSTPMSYIVGADGQCVGHIIKRGPKGFDAYDREGRSLGLFKSAAAAANAVFDAAMHERGAG